MLLLNFFSVFQLTPMEGSPELSPTPAGEL